MATAETRGTLPADRVTAKTEAYRRFVEGRLMGMRSNRYSFWTHWRELADYFLPRRYKWIVTPNQQSRGAPINQHIIDNSGTFAARNLASGLLTGKCNPTRNWFKLKIGRIDSTLTTPVSLWLAECERLMRLVFSESNFYVAMAVLLYDLVIFGTGAMLIHEDFDQVINCVNPCLGEYYVDVNGQYRPVIFYREFTLTVSAIVSEFGLENCPKPVRDLYEQKTGTNLTREFVVAHAIEPNDDGRASEFGISDRFKFRECYWVWGGSGSPQGGGSFAQTFLRTKGYYEQCAIVGRWDLVSNDPYGRSPGMDGLGDQKQLQLETKRKAQAIDKMVNPPLVADIQLQNKPASLLPGAITYISNFAATGKAAISSIYDNKFPVSEITEDLAEVRERIKKVFFNDLFQVISQFETRSNITATEIDARRSEAMIMLGPVIERIDNEVLGPIITRVFNIMKRAGIFPPPPAEIAKAPMNVEFVSMLAQAQEAAAASGIERLFGISGNLAGIKPEIGDNIDYDFALDKYSSLLNNDPRIIRPMEAVAQIREDRAKAQQEQQMAQQAEAAKNLAPAAKVLSDTPVSSGGGSTNMLSQMLGGAAG